MKDQVDAIDKEAKEEHDKIVEESEKQGGFSKLLVYNKPAYLIYLGAFMAVFGGAAQPVVGLIFSELLVYLSTPFEYIDILAAMDNSFQGTSREYLMH
jgi:hypothetical protein